MNRSTEVLTDNVNKYSNAVVLRGYSDHYRELFLGSPELNSLASLVNVQLVRLLPALRLHRVMFYLKYLFLPVCFIIPGKSLSDRG